MRKLFVILTILTFFASAMSAQKARFCNLTAEELKIDSLLPFVAYDYTLPDNHADSIYTAAILYPEYLDMPVSDVELYKAITSETPGETPAIDITTVYSRKKGKLVANFCPIVFRNGRYQYLVSFMIEFKAEAKPLQARSLTSTAPAARYATKSVLSSGVWAKIRVPETGIYELTDAVVRRAGFKDMSKVKIYGYGGNLVPEELTPEYLAEFDDLKELPTCTVNGKRLFYANGSVSWKSATDNTRIRNPYSDYGYYFLTQSDGNPATITEQDLLNTYNSDHARHHQLFETDNYAWFEGGRNLYNSKEYAKGQSAEYTLTIPKDNNAVRITVSVSGDTKDGITEVYFNDVLLGKQSMAFKEYDKFGDISTTWQVTDNVREVNTLRIKNVSHTFMRMDYVATAFQTAAPAPDLTTTAFPAPEFVHRITNQNHHAEGQYDMIIIIPTNQKIRYQAERLKAHHESHDNLSVKIVPADELYNEFSSGTPDVSAYRRYMKMLYDRATTEEEMPKHVLLMGDGLWDNRMLTNVGKKLDPNNYLLCFESENSKNDVYSFVCDDFVGMLDDNETIYDKRSTKNVTGIPDIGVGRLPVTTVTQAQTAVNKIIHYATHSNDGKWQNNVAFLGDDGNNNIHMKAQNDLADSLYQWKPGLNIHKIMWDTYPRVTTSTGARFPDITTTVKKMQDEGTLVFNYAGHGAPTSVSHELVLTLNDFNLFKGNNYSMWVGATCDIMPFDNSETNIGETALLNENGGAIAFYGTARTVIAGRNDYINRSFTKFLFKPTDDGSVRTIGDANRLAKEEMTLRNLDLSENKLQYNIIGDPALKLAIPEAQVVIDSINGTATDSGSTVSLQAGGIATIEGHIVHKSETVENFNGLVNLIVKDAKQNIVCKLNNTSDKDGSTTAFKYQDYTNVLYQGSDSVRSGKFKLVFAVTKDITYTMAKGLITAYAVNNEKTLAAHGSYDNFTVGAADDVPNDSIGPSVYCYLNTPGFTNGSVVNSTPFFVAQISDEDGINASGSGIGHDMLLTIDDQPTTTYIVNDNFQFDFGSYTTGQTYFSIPQLSPGRHRLKFRVWDIQNNPSTTVLDFNVQASLKPTIAAMYATPNPARDSVKFVVAHDRQGSDVRVMIDLMDGSGRLLWTSSDISNSTDSQYVRTWDLRLDTGAKLQSGVYLYRVRISSDGSEYTSDAKKLIVLH